MKREIYPKFLYVICVLLIAGLAITLWAKYKTYRMFALPFCYHVIFDGVVFLVPCIMLFVIGKVLERRQR